MQMAQIVTARFFNIKSLGRCCPLYTHHVAAFYVRCGGFCPEKISLGERGEGTYKMAKVVVPFQWGKVQWYQQLSKRASQFHIQDT